MRVVLLKWPTSEDWILCRKAALTTAGKETDAEPSYKQKYRLLDAEHSPIRLLNFTFRLEGIPYYVSNHLVRHHVGCTPFVRSQRNDRQSLYDRTSARQDAPVDMMWQLNAQSLIDVCHKRLCGMADPMTRKIVEMMKDAVLERCPEFKDFLVPECDYRGHWCHEIKGCGRCMKAPAPWE